MSKIKFCFALLIKNMEILNFFFIFFLPSLSKAFIIAFFDLEPYVGGQNSITYQIWNKLADDSGINYTVSFYSNENSAVDCVLKNRCDGMIGKYNHQLSLSYPLFAV